MKIKGEKQIFMAAAIRCVCPKMRGVLEHIYELANSWRKVAKVQVHSHCFASSTFYNDNDNRYHWFRQDVFLLFFGFSFSSFFRRLFIYVQFPLNPWGSQYPNLSMPERMPYQYPRLSKFHFGRSPPNRINPDSFATMAVPGADK